MYIKDKNYNPLFDRVLVLVDVAMVTLVLINLVMLGVQMNFESESIREFIKLNSPAFHDWYMPVYQNFPLIDGVFVAVFVAELLIRWFIAIINRTYHRWFFYPFVHWYEVMGCIPLGSFRVLRILRVVAIIIRLNRMGVIDIRQWYLYKVFKKYLGILTEEISDRVVVNVIEGIQKEVETGIPLTGRILEQVVLPRKEVLVGFISHRVQLVTQKQYEENMEALRKSIREAVTDAISQNENIQLLEAIPLVGKAASSALQQSVYEITFETIHNIFQSFTTDENRLIIEKITDGIIDALMIKEEDEKLRKTFSEMIVHALDLVKSEVSMKRWKQRESSDETSENLNFGEK